MKLFINYLIIFCAFCYTSTAQVPVSGHTSDQVVQGPCYIFATVAALESNAMQNGCTNVNFNEWQFYSTCVMGSKSGTAQIMIPKSVQHFGQNGAHSGQHLSPTAQSCPNPNDPLVPCVAEFDCFLEDSWCESDLMYFRVPEPGCNDNENTDFEFMSFGNSYHTASSLGYQRIDLAGLTTAQKSTQISTLLGQNIGVIANFAPWRTAGAHSLFIYDDIEGGWKYKDSWPGDAGLRQGGLNLSLLQEIYYITGDVNCAPPACLKRIYGSRRVVNTHTYTLGGSGNASNINWFVSSNLTIVSTNGNSIQVKPNTCSNTTGTITVTYNNGCTESKNVSIAGASPRPRRIVVASPQWNAAGQTCPNTQLELIALINTGHTNLYYDWDIAGAALISGQGTSSVIVQTPPGNSNLYFKVRTKRANCPYSAWRTLSGYSSNSNNGCNGGGGGVRVDQSNNDLSMDFEKFFEINPDMDLVNFNIFSIEGKHLHKGEIRKSNPYVMLDKLDIKGLIVIQLYNMEFGFSESHKQWIMK